VKVETAAVCSGSGWGRVRLWLEGDERPDWPGALFFRTLQPDLGTAGGLWRRSDRVCPDYAVSFGL